MFSISIIGTFAVRMSEQDPPDSIVHSRACGRLDIPGEISTFRLFGSMGDNSGRHFEIVLSILAFRIEVHEAHSKIFRRLKCTPHIPQSPDD